MHTIAKIACIVAQANLHLSSLESLFIKQTHNYTISHSHINLFFKDYIVLKYIENEQSCSDFCKFSDNDQWFLSCLRGLYALCIVPYSTFYSISVAYR